MSSRLTVAAGLDAVRAAREASGACHARMLRHGTLAVEFYAPVETDHPLPHPRDAAFVIAAGSATSVCGGEPHPVEPGEVVFVAAGTAHHFEEASGDFAAWVLFYGPVGGEGPDAEIPPHR
ncbi:MAG TPA: cupin domain-containing protein [Rubricoccaceae bacterium]|jgi:mannose-6-phosphate isomerase-like protein (cupin superfamily)